MVDDYGPSQTLKEMESRWWLKNIKATERTVNNLVALTAPDLLYGGQTALDHIKHRFSDHPGVQSWPSVFSGISVIVNRKTLPHRDQGGWNSAFDFLVAAGTYEDSQLHVHDAQATFQYRPGCVIAICGKVLSHSVPSWTGGERICYAHFMRDAVWQRLGIRRSSWVSQGLYAEFMSPGFLRRMGDLYV
jgi:hypothetical protein